MSDSWVVWSEEHGGWWMPEALGYTRSLREAGRFSESRAKQIERNANVACRPGEFNEVVLPDPMPSERVAKLTEPRIVIGILGEPFERDQEAKVITLAAGALAAVAAVGNRESDLLFSVLKAIADTDQTLSPDAQAKLRQLGDELVASVRCGKRFVALAGFRRGAEGSDVSLSPVGMSPGA